MRLWTNFNTASIPLVNKFSHTNVTIIARQERREKVISMTSTNSPIHINSTNSPVRGRHECLVSSFINFPFDVSQNKGCLTFLEILPTYAIYGISNKLWFCWESNPKLFLTKDLCYQFGQNYMGVIPRKKSRTCASKNSKIASFHQRCRQPFIKLQKWGDSRPSPPPGGSDIRGDLFWGLFLQMISDMNDQIAN